MMDSLYGHQYRQGHIDSRKDEPYHLPYGVCGQQWLRGKVATYQLCASERGCSSYTGLSKASGCASSGVLLQMVVFAHVMEKPLVVHKFLQPSQ